MMWCKHITKWDKCEIMNDLKKEGQTGILTTGFKFLPSKLMEYTCCTAYMIEIVSYQSCSSSINFFLTSLCFFFAMVLKWYLRILAADGLKSRNVPIHQSRSKLATDSYFLKQISITDVLNFYQCNSIQASSIFCCCCKKRQLIQIFYFLWNATCMAAVKKRSWIWDYFMLDKEVCSM